MRSATSRTAGKIPFREDASLAMDHDRRVGKGSNGQTISLLLNSPTFNKMCNSFNVLIVEDTALLIFQHQSQGLSPENLKSSTEYS